MRQPSQSSLMQMLYRMQQPYAAQQREIYHPRSLAGQFNPQAALQRGQQDALTRWNAQVKAIQEASKKKKKDPAPVADVIDPDAMWHPGTINYGQG